MAALAGAFAGRVLGQTVQWSAGVLGQALGTWLGRGSSIGESTCICKFEGSVDSGVISLLQRQLDRCGPENLVRQESVPQGWGASDWVFVSVLVTLAFFLGLAAREYTYVVRFSSRPSSGPAAFCARMRRTTLLIRAAPTTSSGASRPLREESSSGMAASECSMSKAASLSLGVMPLVPSSRLG